MVVVDETTELWQPPEHYIAASLHEVPAVGCIEKTKIKKKRPTVQLATVKFAPNRYLILKKSKMGLKD